MGSEKPEGIEKSFNGLVQCLASLKLERREVLVSFLGGLSDGDLSDVGMALSELNLAIGEVMEGRRHIQSIGVVTGKDGEESAENVVLGEWVNYGMSASDFVNSFVEEYLAYVKKIISKFTQVYAAQESFDKLLKQSFGRVFDNGLAENCRIDGECFVRFMNPNNGSKDPFLKHRIAFEVAVKLAPRLGSEGDIAFYILPFSISAKLHQANNDMIFGEENLAPGSEYFSVSWRCDNPNPAKGRRKLELKNDVPYVGMGSLMRRGVELSTMSGTKK